MLLNEKLYIVVNTRVLANPQTPLIKLAASVATISQTMLYNSFFTFYNINAIKYMMMQLHLLVAFSHFIETCLLNKRCFAE